MLNVNTGIKSYVNNQTTQSFGSRTGANKAAVALAATLSMPASHALDIEALHTPAMMDTNKLVVEEIMRQLQDLTAKKTPATELDAFAAYQIDKNNKNIGYAIAGKCKDGKNVDVFFNTTCPPPEYTLSVNGMIRDKENYFPDKLPEFAKKVTVAIEEACLKAINVINPSASILRGYPVLVAPIATEYAVNPKLIKTDYKLFNFDGSFAINDLNGQELTRDGKKIGEINYDCDLKLRLNQRNQGNQNIFSQPQPQSIPEPGTIALFFAGLLAMLRPGRKK